MTTKITVDAHAGWPVEVTRRSRADPSHSTHIVVEPNTKQDIFIWDDNELVIREGKHPTSPNVKVEVGS
jgi:hypothetical protein